MADLESFRSGLAVLRDMRAALRADRIHAGAVEALREGLTALCEGAHAFQPHEKLACFRRARGAVSRAVAELLVESTEPLEEPFRSWLAELERGVLPSLGGLLRWTEKLERQER